MKKIAFSFALVLGAAAASAQVEVDKPIQLTGSGSDAKISGIQEVSGAQDAVSAEVVQSNALNYGADSGTADAYALSLSPAIGGYSAGQIFSFLASNANTGASTLNVDGQGAVSIKKNSDGDLAADDIKAGQLVTVVYDGTNFQMISQLGNAGGGGSGGGDPTLIYTTDGF